MSIDGLPIRVGHRSALSVNSFWIVWNGLQHVVRPAMQIGVGNKKWRDAAWRRRGTILRTSREPIGGRLLISAKESWIATSHRRVFVDLTTTG
jgi:hypothetical protein